MKTRPLGPGAPSVPVVGFGGMPLSIADRPDEATAIDVLHAALDAGMRLIDTANVYCLENRDLGHNERLIAKAVSSWSGPGRADVIVGTKGGMTRPGGRWERDARPEHLKLSCEHSLRALGVDTIDLYQLHAPDPKVPFADSVGALGDLQREGKVRWIGLSNVSVDQIREAESMVKVVTVQNRLSPFFREALTGGVVEYCERHGIGFLAYSPVGGGRLNKKLPHHPILTRIAEAHDATPHQIALAWVLAQGDSVIIIPGARTISHTEASAGAAAIALTPQELAEIDGAKFSTA
jgi:aryl-alcohol dehydrogenase-like predicted oxidoreductase